jgi:hypothetical protein
MHQCIPRREQPARIDDKTVFTAHDAEKGLTRKPVEGVEPKKYASEE